jgi:hypothetical protein
VEWNVVVAKEGRASIEHRVQQQCAPFTKPTTKQGTADAGTGGGRAAGAHALRGDEEEEEEEDKKESKH